MDEDLRYTTFEKEIALINNLEIQNWVVASLKNASDYFWTAPASSTGEYHPACSNVIGGLVIHVKRVVWIANAICAGWGVFERDRDIVLAACLLHDIAKSASYTDFNSYEDHPINAKNFFAESSAEFVKEVYQCVRLHMGRWSPRSVTKPIKDYTPLELAVYTSDYLSSQKRFKNSEGWLMAEMRFEFKERVKIIPYDWKGVVKAVSITETGISYLVRYFYNGKAEEVYFYEDELEKFK